MFSGIMLTKDLASRSKFKLEPNPCQSTAIDWKSFSRLLMGSETTNVKFKATIYDENLFSTDDA